MHLLKKLFNKKYKMKKYIITLILCLYLFPSLASANTTGYAWSESVGWFDFSPAVVSNTDLTGYAYNDNTGWLVLSNITNNNGTLEGYAWSESVGWFDFSNVYIEDNQLKGYAYNDNTGFLNFTDGTVTTTWSTPTPQQPRRRSGSIPDEDIVNSIIIKTDQTREQLEQTLRSLLVQLITILQAQLEQLQANN